MKSVVIVIPSAKTRAKIAGDQVPAIKLSGLFNRKKIGFLFHDSDYSSVS